MKKNGSRTSVPNSAADEAVAATLAVVSWTGYTLGASVLMSRVQGAALVSQEASFGFPALRQNGAGSTPGRGIQ